jgi:hypothetical protein
MPKKPMAMAMAMAMPMPMSMPMAMLMPMAISMSMSIGREVVSRFANAVPAKSNSAARAMVFDVRAAWYLRNQCWA